MEVYKNISILRSYSAGILVLILLFSGSSTFAQRKREKPPRLLPNRFEEGYILTETGDSIPGFLLMGNRFEAQSKIKFYDYYGGRATYFPNRLKGYGYEQTHFMAQETPFQFAGAFADSAIFLQRMVEGPASLYRFYTRRSALTFQKGPAFLDLLIMPDGTEHEVSYAFKWKRIADWLEEHPTLSEQIRAGTFSPEETLGIISMYNDWYRKTHQQAGVQP